jgi:hypothetical protein
MVQDINNHELPGVMPPPLSTPDAKGFTPLQFDPASYRAHVADLGLDADHEAELLRTLWAIMSGFVDLGFRIHPVQQAVSARAAAPDNFLVETIAGMLASDINSISNINDMNADRAPAIAADGE